LRVDHVVYRALDTRIYHEFGKDYLLREVQYRESTYEALKKGFEKDPNALHDPNSVVSVLPIKETFVQKIYFK